VSEVDRQQREKDIESLESTLTGPLSAALITIAIFSLSVMSFVPDPAKSLIDEVFGILGLVSLISAALILDAELDKRELTFRDRRKLYSSGYIVFCGSIGGMSSAILFFYADVNRTGPFPICTLIGVILFGFCIGGRLMTKSYNNCWLVGMLAAFVLFVIALRLSPGVQIAKDFFKDPPAPTLAPCLSPQPHSPTPRSSPVISHY